MDGFNLNAIIGKLGGMKFTVLVLAFLYNQYVAPLTTEQWVVVGTAIGIQGLADGLTNGKTSTRNTE